MLGLVADLLDIDEALDACVELAEHGGVRDDDDGVPWGQAEHGDDEEESAGVDLLVRDFNDLIGYYQG